jgi:hypothetical protein
MGHWIEWRLRMNLDAIAQAYVQILNDLEQHFLDRSRESEPGFAKLSGLFLPAVPAGFAEAKHRIMVVGRETRGWTILKKDQPFVSIEAYVKSALEKHQKFLADALPKPTDKGASFFNLMRAISKQSGSEGLIWANLFCASWAGNSPMKSPQFETIRRYSELLLKKQIELFQPQTIIFANGASSAHHRKAFFPSKGELSVCSESGDFVADGIPRDHLWRFRLNGSIQCYRIQHPSSRSKEARAARHYLVNEILAKRADLPVSAGGII